MRVPGPVRPAKRGLSRQAENLADFDDYSGVEMVDRSNTDGLAVGAEAGDWVSFHHVTLSRGIGELRLGSADGRLLGSAVVESTGDRYAYESVQVPLDDVPGGRTISWWCSAGTCARRSCNSPAEPGDQLGAAIA